MRARGRDRRRSTRCDRPNISRPAPASPAQSSGYSVAGASLPEGTEGKDLLRLPAQHVGDERQVVRRGEWRHRLPGVRLDDPGQRGHGAGHLGLRHKAHDAQHGEAAVVDLHDEPFLLLLLTSVLGDAERVVQVERHRVRHAGVLDRGVEAGLAAHHVVLLALRLGQVARLAKHLEERDRAEDLQLRLRGQGVPLLRRRPGV
mmetsp:Transcript_16899/g.38193  ORF Transcript_16899/g.38193 Transcript_16899/m.38193 type:complete len:202 (-) Transcript_16899:116-721(-)